MSDPIVLDLGDLKCARQVAIAVDLGAAIGGEVTVARPDKGAYLRALKKGRRQEMGN